MLKISESKQQEIVKFVADTFSDYENSMTEYRERMLRIYNSVRTFQSVKVNNRDTTFKVNKAHEIVNKKLPKIYSSARNTKRLVNYKSDDYIDNGSQVSINDMAEAIRDKLYNIFEKQDLKEVMRLWAKSGLQYGIGRAKVDYAYKVSRNSEKATVIEYNDLGEQVEVPTKVVKEKVSESYACLKNKLWTDMYYDPKYVRLEDMPGIIDLNNNIRLSYFTKNKDDYINVDQITDLCNLKNDPQGFRQRVLQITGINKEGLSIDSKNLQVKCFYGYYDVSDNDDMSDERLYEFRTVNDLVLVFAKEITQIPFEEFKCFDDTETFYATGVVEPILGLQDEMNFKKNAGSTYINQALYRSYIVGSSAGIDPRKLSGGAGNIIISKNDAVTSLANIQEIPHRDISPNFFQEQNDFERQIQSATFSLDTSTPQTQQALTNTATGAKIQAQETNAVDEEIRNHFETAMVKIAYKFLQKEFDMGDDIMVYKKQGKEEFWNIHKDAMRDAVNRYEIKIEAGSSASDSIDNKRNDEIAKWNISKDAKTLGVPVDMKKMFESVIDTFEGVDKKTLFEPVNQLPQMGMPNTSNVPMIPTGPASQ